jgi:hypothetical protein
MDGLSHGDNQISWSSDLNPQRTFEKVLSMVQNEESRTWLCVLVTKGTLDLNKNM